MPPKRGGRGGRSGRGGGGAAAGGGGRNVWTAKSPVNLTSIMAQPLPESGAVLTAMDQHRETGTLFLADRRNLKITDVELNARRPDIVVEGPITALRVHQNLLFVAMYAVIPNHSAVEVGVIAAYDMTNNFTQKLLLGPSKFYSHRDKVTALETANIGGQTVLFSGAADGTMAVWGLGSSGEWQSHPLEGHIRQVSSLQWIAGRLYSCSHDGTIQIWNPARALGEWRVGTLLPQHHGHTEQGSKVQRLVALTAVTIAATPATHGAGVPAAAEQCFLFSGAEDGSIRSWDLSNPDQPNSIRPASVSSDYARRGNRTLTTMTMMRVPAPQAATGVPHLVCGFSDGFVILRSMTDNFQEEKAGVGKGRHGSGGHFKEIIQIVPLQQPGNELTDLFMTSSMDHFFSMWRFTPR